VLFHIVGLEPDVKPENTLPAISAPLKVSLILNDIPVSFPAITVPAYEIK
jgi:hypothetical protein